MKTSPETKRINNKASHTALIAAIHRFLASKERRLGFTGPDVPTTQNEKIILLGKSKTPIPENVHFVTIDFDRDDLKQILFRAGYDPTGRSMFIWEGVTMYIKEEAVNRILTFVRYNSGPCSNQLIP